MRRFLIAALLFLLSVVSASAQTIHPPKGITGKEWGSVLALYGTRGDTTKFVCTAEPIEKIPGGYRLLTAGHCVQLSPVDLKFSVAEEIGGVRTPVDFVKVVMDSTMDFALFDLRTTKNYHVFTLGIHDKIHIGDRTINPNFAYGLGRQLSYGVVASAPMVASPRCTVEDGCVGEYLVQQFGGPGASGSPVLSAKTHHIIGLMILEPDGNIGFGVEPISQFEKFLKVATQPHPSETGADAPSITIPEDEFKDSFGQDHPFMLTVHGPDPQFTLAGWTFEVVTDGLELSDEFYYDVPVFIGEDEGNYFLVSTNQGFSVELTIVKAPENK